MTFEIISVFNHKGGVSKTTTTFNLAWMLAQKGKRVIMVDADPQCNLTGFVLGLNPEWPEDDTPTLDFDDEESRQFGVTQENAEDFWEENFNRTLFGALKPAFDSEPRVLEAVDCLPVEGREGLFLLPGHLRLGEYEVSLGIAQELAGSMPALRNLPGAMYFLLRETAEALNADYVIVDMSPSLGALNQNLVTVSDLLLVPTSPDFFSIMALQSLQRVLPRWARWAEQASANEVLRDASYPFPDPRLKFAGLVIQRYRLYRSPTEDEPYGTPTGPFRAWIDKVASASQEQFVPALHAAGLTFPPDDYEAAGIPPSGVLGQVQEFNSLLPKSQEHHVPVFALTDEQLGQVGVVLDGSRSQIRSLTRIFEAMADRVIALSASAASAS
ncbi:putative ATP-binding protein [Microbacterium sp. TS-1]|uniref:ParA family protein n=1 Tax=Microbacterium sp. TS-1 TaxID=1344956 RepID=UPI00038F8A0E|nr:AAA family ATPase [Microbacterium sp. TS-1]GAD33739.1 putative ATP-binding protein [Microbacterium sp. TS-1]